MYKRRKLSMNISLNGYGTGYATLEAAKGLT